MLGFVDFNRRQLPSRLPQQAVDFNVIAFARRTQSARQRGLAAAAVADDDCSLHGGLPLYLACIWYGDANAALRPIPFKPSRTHRFGRCRQTIAINHLSGREGAPPPTSVEYKRDVYLCGHKCVAWVYEIGKKAVVRNLLSGSQAPGMARRCHDAFKWCDASIPNNGRNIHGSA